MLTLPIEIGKKYVRRDGSVVAAQAVSGDNYADGLCRVATEAEYYDSSLLLAWVDTGLISRDGFPAMAADLVADYIEPAKAVGHPHADRMAEYAETAKSCLVPWRMWECRIDGWTDWQICETHPTWVPGAEYRRKPLGIRIGLFLASNDAILTARAEIEALFASVEKSK